jgi:hypothetical protein
MKWMTMTRVTTMICMILMTSTETKLKYIVCHGEGHTIERHKEDPKRKSRNSGTKTMSRSQGTSAIIEVSHI